MKTCLVSQSGSTREALLEKFWRDGFYVARGLFGVYELEVLKTMARDAIEYERVAYERAGRPGAYGRVFSCVGYGKPFLDIFRNDEFYSALTMPLEEPYPTLHVFTTSSIPPGQTNVFREIHVDSRYHYGPYLEGVGCLVMLDDFLVENGATRVLPGSHDMASRPTEENFDADAVTITGDAGDVLVFHPRLWHRSGENGTDAWRHSLSIGISRPWIRPHVDHYGILARADRLPSDPRLLQLVGVHARPFTSVDDYYARVR